MKRITKDPIYGAINEFMCDPVTTVDLITTFAMQRLFDTYRYERIKTSKMCVNSDLRKYVKEHPEFLTKKGTPGRKALKFIREFYFTQHPELLKKIK